MKKQYIMPQTEVVKVMLTNSVLDDDMNFDQWSHGAAGVQEDGKNYGDAKEGFSDEDMGWSNTSKNLWDD